MELAILCFSGGILCAMLIAAFSSKLINIFLLLTLPIFVTALWYFWATDGASIVMNRVLKNSTVEKNAAFEKNGVSSEAAIESSEKYLAALGQTGDLFGGINSLFAALAFAAVAVAAIMQARSLQLAREQQKQQSFEPLFFHLLSLHQAVSAPKFNLSSRFSTRGKAVLDADGREQTVSFTRAMEVFRRMLRLRTIGIANKDDKSIFLSSECAAKYEVFYQYNQDELGPHFRTLFQIFKLIDTSGFDFTSKVKYANIARSTLGKDQLFLLAVNCLSYHGEKFKPYVEKYGLLKHVDCNKTNPTIDQLLATWCYKHGAQLGAKDRALEG